MTEHETNKLFGFGSFRAKKDKSKAGKKAATTLYRQNNNQSAGGKLFPASQPAGTQLDQSNCCIICVGSTGTGKSSTVGKYTGVQTRAGSGTERVTMHCEIHRSLTDDQEPVWVDTVGWDDAECEDDQTFRDILTFINKYDITKVIVIHDNILF